MPNENQTIATKPPVATLSVYRPEDGEKLIVKITPGDLAEFLANGWKQVE